MNTAIEIKQKAMDLWNSGSVLRARLGCEKLFPLTISAGMPTAGQLQEDFAAAENWKTEIEKGCKCHGGHGYRIEYAEVDHHLERRRWPEKLVFDQPDDLIAFIHKGRELNRFARLLGQIRQADARLLPWCEQHPLKVLEYEKEWSRMLSVLDYFKQNPALNYSRLESDVPGMDNTFIAQHKLLLSQLLDLVLPVDEVSSQLRILG